jgi:hypothetical protein
MFVITTRLRRVARYGAALTAVGALLVTGTTTASAASPAPTTGSLTALVAPQPNGPNPVPAGGVSALVKVPMTIVYRAPARPGVVQPDNEVSGNCGVSWFYIDNAGNGKAHIVYGFEVNSTAYSYFSETYVYGASKNSIVTHSGWLGFLGSGSKDYDNDYTATLGVGYASGTVNEYAVLGNGDVCGSAYPSDFEYVS